jgi:acetyl-CoA acyltransferase
MRDVVIVEGARTPFGRAIKGALKDTRPEDLGAAAIKAAVRKAGVEPGDIQDVALGCAMPEGQQGLNVARVVSIHAGLPEEVPAYTVNRFCSSGLQTIADVATRIGAGYLDIGIAGGVESMTAVPMAGFHPQLHPTIAVEYPQIYIGMGNTAENVAQKYGISREVQDAFAAASQEKATAAREKGIFKAEIEPFEITLDDGSTVTMEHDELIRPGTTAEGLAKLRPAFDPKGTVTAGNASPLTDGAAAVVVMAEETAKKRDAKILGYFRHFVVVGVPPEIMGIGPVPAIRKLLDNTGLSIDDIDVFEINEAFASQSAYCKQELGVPDEKLNPNGGAIALGHPLGVSGTRMALTALYELERRNARRAVISMCIGGGMGAAALVERG